jgi:hypothetical protein
MTAIRAGIITPSTKAELVTAEAEVEAARKALEDARSFAPTQILPRARETWKRLVQRLEDIQNVPQAREAIRELLGEDLVVKEDGGEQYIEMPSCEITMVAGARYVLCPSHRVRITAGGE